MSSAPQLRCSSLSARVEKPGPSMHTYVPWLWTLALTFGAAASISPRRRGTERRGELGVDGELVEEGVRPPEGLVDGLIHHHQIARRDLFLQRARRGAGKHVGHAQLLEGVDVRAVRDERRAVSMSLAVSREERHAHALHLGDDDGLRGLAERGVDVVDSPLPSPPSACPRPLPPMIPMNGLLIWCAP